MDVFQRSLLVLFFLCAFFLLWINWNGNIFNQWFDKKEINKNIIIDSRSHKNNFVKNTHKLIVNNNSNRFISKNKFIILKNDVISVYINKKNGNIEKVELLKYKHKLDSNFPFCLLNTKFNFIYQAQSGFFIKDGLKSIHLKFIQNSKKNFFEIKSTEKKIEIPLTWIDRTGLIYVKTFILFPGKYHINIKNSVINKTKKKIDISFFNHLIQTVKLPSKRYINQFNTNLYKGIAYSTDTEKYKKYSFDNLFNEKELFEVTSSGWIAMLEKYFVSAWIPQYPGISNIIYTKMLNNNIALIGSRSELIHLVPKAKCDFISKLWIGPAIQTEMANVAANLDLTLDYGVFWFISQPLFKILSCFYSVLGSWGWSIVLLTLFIRLVMYPLSRSQYISMERIKSIQPKIDLIKNQYKNDKKKMSQEIISLYKSEKINPLGGCLPVIIQMPIFLALYYMLINSVELRHSPFLFWINDLSDRDPYYIFPVFMGLTMWIIQFMTSNHSMDDNQKKIMNFIPILFTIFFLWFPSGLVLYYITSNIFTIFQQYWIKYKLKSKIN